MARRAPNEVGISPSPSPKFPLVWMPYGCLVPRDIDGGNAIEATKNFRWRGGGLMICS